MTIPQMPINYNPSPTPMIYEQQTSGRQDMQNRGDIGKANVVIQRDTDLVPFTQLGDPNIYNYKKERNSPTLDHPIHTNREAAAAPSDEKPGSAEENYTELHGQLPSGLKADMEAYPSNQTVSLDNLLKSVAGGMVWQESVKVLLSSENATNRMEVNNRYPDGSFANTVASGKDYVESALQLLNNIGPNHPHYLEVKGFVDTVKTDLAKLEENK